MNLVSKISKRSLSALDFGAEKVSILIAEKITDKEFRILGSGDAPTEGISGGEITSIGDVVESVVTAVRRAEKSAGLEIDTLYFNQDDAQMESIQSWGSKTLKGEGQIVPVDAEEARVTAERLIGHFEKNTLYSKELKYLIDDKDTVLNPVGIFGRKLDVCMHFLLARSSQSDEWSKIMKRSGILKAVPVLSAWSTAYGILPEEDRQRTRVIVDAGADFLNIFLFGNNMISAFKTFSANKAPDDRLLRIMESVKELMAQNNSAEQILITGDLSEEESLMMKMRELVTIPIHQAAPFGFEKLTQAKYASLAGLLRVADELQKKIPVMHREKGMVAGTKAKLMNLINEYF
jgi:hypothetical protein